MVIPRLLINSHGRPNGDRAWKISVIATLSVFDCSDDGERQRVEKIVPGVDEIDDGHRRQRRRRHRQHDAPDDLRQPGASTIGRLLDLVGDLADERDQHPDGKRGQHAAHDQGEPDQRIEQPQVAQHLIERNDGHDLR